MMEYCVTARVKESDEDGLDLLSGLRCFIFERDVKHPIDVVLSR